MRSFGFMIAIWIVVLFIGLLPLPPAAELIIVVAFVAQCVWFIRRRLRRAARLRALARAEKAEEEEFRRRRRRRAVPGDSTQLSTGAQFADPKHHGVFVGWSIDPYEGSK